jgi:hypothetical protein
VAIKSLWHTPAKWIPDPFEYVFLPRAMLEIGAALFPDEWTGREPEKWEAARVIYQKRADDARQRCSASTGWCSELRRRQSPNGGHENGGDSIVFRWAPREREG